jgi:TorA maturation chaperone TorD
MHLRQTVGVIYDETSGTYWNWKKSKAKSEDEAKAKGYQREFLDQHLGLWAGQFSKKVGELANLPFYAEIAALTRDFIEAECQELNKASVLKELAN